MMILLEWAMRFKKVLNVCESRECQVAYSIFSNKICFTERTVYDRIQILFLQQLLHKIIFFDWIAQRLIVVSW